MKVKVYAPVKRQAPVRDVLTIIVASSDGKREYRVHQLPDGRFSCTCPDFEYRGEAPGYNCKHIKYVRSKSADDVTVQGTML